MPVLIVAFILDDAWVTGLYIPDHDLFLCRSDTTDLNASLIDLPTNDPRFVALRRVLAYYGPMLAGVTPSRTDCDMIDLDQPSGD